MEKLKNLPILMYHNVLKKSEAKIWNNFCIEPAMFAAHLDYLVKKGYTSIDFSDLDNIISGRTLPPEKPVIITLDDAYARAIENVAPVLYSKKMKGVFSVVTGCIGKESFWEKDNTGSMTVSKKQIKDYSKGLISFESHTERHEDLSQLNGGKLDLELSASRKLLEEIAGKKVRAVFYPYGAYNQAVKVSAARAGYRFGLAIATRKRTVTEDLFEMRRIYVKESDSFGDFKRKVAPWYLWFRGLKEARRGRI